MRVGLASSANKIKTNHLITSIEFHKEFALQITVGIYKRTAVTAKMAFFPCISWQLATAIVIN